MGSRVWYFPWFRLNVPRGTLRGLGCGWNGRTYPCVCLRTSQTPLFLTPPVGGYTVEVLLVLQLTWKAVCLAPSKSLQCACLARCRWGTGPRRWPSPSPSTAHLTLPALLPGCLPPVRLAHLSAQRPEWQSWILHLRPSQLLPRSTVRR